MNRKKRKQGRSKKSGAFPAHPQFKDRNLTSIETMRRSGKSLQSPFSELDGKISFTSWIDACIPNALWVCILTSFLDQDEYLNLFRKVVANARENLENRKNLFITHNYLGVLSDSDFDGLLGPIFEHAEAKHLLRALRLVESLPDKRHWARNVTEPDTDFDQSILVHAVADNFDHQSQRATDIRWFKLAFSALAREQIILPPKLLDQIGRYPNYGDMQSVRPSIRAAEIAFRSFELPTEGVGPETKSSEFASPPRVHANEFWEEMLKSSGCVFPKHSVDLHAGSAELTREVLDILEKVDTHFFETLEVSSADPRHDGAFGLCLYATTLLFDSAHGYVHGRPEGRIVLRAISEALITLRFLTLKDDETLWLKYRRYGAGQAKLSFLKFIRDADVPDYVDIEVMEHLANEDMWLEFEDIDLGNWAGTDLRKMAMEADSKDVYDRYYDWASGYSHGHWAAVRDSVFVNCLNPLHRFHRVPSLPKAHMPSTLIDCCKLCNRMLDDLNKLYPVFKARIRWHKQPKAPAFGDAAPDAGSVPA